MMISSRYFSLLCILLFGVYLFSQEAPSSSKQEGQAIQTTRYYYQFDSATGTYRMHQVPGLHRDADNQSSSMGFAPQVSYGSNWFETSSTAGISEDGKTLFLQRWGEREDQPVKLDPKTGLPNQARTFKIQEEQQAISIEQKKVKFFNAEGQELSIEEARTLLSQSKIIVLYYGAKPAPGVLSVFGKKTVIAVLPGSPVVAY
jgi:hypothetical protein